MTDRAQKPPPANRRVRVQVGSAAVAIGAGIQAASLLGSHPLGFVAFLVVGCPMVVGGAILAVTASSRVTMSRTRAPR